MKKKIKNNLLINLMVTNIEQKYLDYVIPFSFYASHFL